MCESKMGSTLWILFLCMCVLIHLELSDGSLIESKWWNHKLQLNSKYNFSVFWNNWNNLDGEWLEMEMSAASGETDFVAIGFSTKGQMEGADMVLGFIHNGNPYLMDLHGIGQAAPEKDSVVDYELISGSSLNGMSRFRFKRKWNTCDKYDFALNDDTVHLIWAIGPMDLQDNGTVPLYHKDARGSRAILLKTNSHGYNPMPDHDLAKSGEIEDMDFWEFSPENVVEGDSTVYMVGIIKLPYKGRAQLIGFKPFLDSEDGYQVHHMLFFGCRNITKVNEISRETMLDKFIGLPSVDFFGNDVAGEWLKLCNTFEFVWTIGSEGFILPNQMGIPMGEENGGFSYLMYQIHFDNPNKKIFVDRTGGRFYITKPDNPRPYDSAMFTVAHRVSLFHLIPPHKQSYKVRAFCPAECTSSVFPKDGLTVTSVLLHSHQTTTAMKLRLFRNGVELQPLAQDLNYDPTYQEWRNVYPHRKLLPGDELIVECTHNTTGRVNVTLGGIEATTEMCVAFVRYFPKTNFRFCESQPDYNSFFRALGIQAKQIKSALLRSAGYPHPNNPLDDIIPMRRYTNSIGYRDALHFIQINREGQGVVTFGEYLRNYDWTNRKEEIPLEERMYGREQDLRCESVQSSEHYIYTPTNPKKKYVEEAQPCPIA